MLFALLVVCAGAVVVLKYLLPRMSGLKKWQKGDTFELVSRFNLDYKRTIYLVRVGKKYLVLGGAEGGLQLLAELPEGDVTTREHHGSKIA